MLPAAAPLNLGMLGGLVSLLGDKTGNKRPEEGGMQGLKLRC